MACQVLHARPICVDRGPIEGFPTEVNRLLLQRPHSDKEIRGIDDKNKFLPEQKHLAGMTNTCERSFAFKINQTSTWPGRINSGTQLLERSPFLSLTVVHKFKHRRVK